ncbi:MAG: T9SS type A sorting domain-containing protein [Bacteroidales bacterium]|nr:T9SS type A sorting domain-containing protein [Bacteroidales bacterium]
MIKKLLLLIPFLGITFAMMAQPCVPGPQTTPGVYPDSATNLPHAYANTVYETVMTVFVPSDTSVGGVLIQIDSIGITGFQGLPPGFSYATNTVSGFWHGGQKGCVLITGMHSAVGTWPLVIDAQAVAAGGGIVLPYTIDYYKIVIDSTHLSIEMIDDNAFEVFQNQPNPFSGNTEISFVSDVNDVYSFEVFDMIGKVVYSEAISAHKGMNKFNYRSNGLTEGVYFFKIGNDKRSTTKRMIISDL